MRNHHYEEALQLHNYVKKLNKKLPTVPIIEDIARNVDNSVKLMLQQLLGQLRSPVQLPQCLKVDIFIVADSLVLYLLFFGYSIEFGYSCCE